MHRLFRRSPVSCLLRHRATAAAAQASRDVNIKWYSVASGSVNEAPPKEKDDTLLLGKLYESAGVESKEPTPTILHGDLRILSKRDYDEFYQKTFDEHLKPFTSCHHKYFTTGGLQFSCILYIPDVTCGGTDNDIVPSGTKNVRLYSKGVLVSDDFGVPLLPSYLSFVKGVVDCNCFPLHVSNRCLQESRIVLKLRKWLLHQTLFGMLARLERPEYRKFWERYGEHMKSGLEDPRNHIVLATLLPFLSSNSRRGVINLDGYIENMRWDQKDIYYIVSDLGSDARNLPIVKRFVETGVEVLIAFEPCFEGVIQNLKSFSGKNFLDIRSNHAQMPKSVTTVAARFSQWLPFGATSAAAETGSNLSSSTTSNNDAIPDKNRLTWVPFSMKPFAYDEDGDVYDDDDAFPRTSRNKWDGREDEYFYADDYIEEEGFDAIPDRKEWEGNEDELIEEHNPRKSAAASSSELFDTIVSNRSLSVETVLSNWVEQGKDLGRMEVNSAMLNFRKRRMYEAALQLSKWLETNKKLDFVERDYALRLDLIAKVHCLHKAESYMDSIPKSFRGEIVYRTLLANSVR